MGDEMKKRLLICFFIVWGMCVAAYGHESDDQSKKLEALVEQLGDKNFKLRRQATEALSKLLEEDEKTADLLEAFEDHKDPEVRFRIRELLGQRGTTLKPIDLAKLKDISSGTSGVGVQVEFRNKSKKNIKIFWIDWDGNHKPWRGILKPGDKQICEKSYETHVWLLTDEKDKPLALYVLGKENTVIQYK